MSRPTLPSRASGVPAYPLLFLLAWIFNVLPASGSPVEATVRPVIAAIVFTTGAIALLSAATRRPHFAAYAVWLALAFLTLMPLLVVLGALAVLLATLRAVRHQQGIDGVPWVLMTRAMNVIALLLLSTALLGSEASGALSPIPQTNPVGSTATTNSLPDLFFILLDGHPRADTLNADFGLDIEPFLAEMQDLGFVVARDSHSNYNATLLTVTSMMTAQQVPDILSPDLATRAAEERALTRAIAASSVLGRAKALGYSVDWISSPFTSPVDWGADEVIGTSGVTDFELNLVSHTLIPWLVPDLVRTSLYQAEHEAVLQPIDRVAELASEHGDGPRLVFAHVLAPHPPLILAADGTVADGFPCFPTSCGMWDIGERYGDAIIQPTVDELSYLDARIVAAVGTIIASEDRPCSIVVFSDHGYRWHQDDRQEQFRNLLLTYTPGFPDLIPNDATPVNLLARILNAYAGTSIPYTEEGSYWTPVNGEEGSQLIVPIQPFDLEP